MKEFYISSSLSLQRNQLLSICLYTDFKPDQTTTNICNISLYLLLQSNGHNLSKNKKYKQFLTNILVPNRCQLTRWTLRFQLLWTTWRQMYGDI